ncbi:MAG: hypothetical protein CMD20_03275 [Flavobacteriales bacterium]|nr:hypothetical protein [Flavobacteriales bacterium]
MKIVIISQHIFPMQTPRAHRTTELMIELAKRGYDVTVYAVLGKYDYTLFQQETGIKIKAIPIKWQLIPYSSDLEVRRTFLDKLLGKLLNSRFEFPEIEFKYRIFDVLKKETNIDVLISIADPHHIHWGVARAKEKLKELFPKKWIADCGDPFMMNNHTNDHLLKFEKEERFFCKNVDFITVPVEKAPDSYYPEYKNKFRIIPQGFRFQTPENQVFSPINSTPTFVFAGTFLRDIRNPEKIFEFLSSYKGVFKFVIYTKYLELVDPYMTTLGDKLEIRNQVSREELLSELKKMDFLLNLENENSPGQTPSKLIDYSIANRPILSLQPSKPNLNQLQSFLEGDYSEAYTVKNLEQFKIENVVDKFLDL